jgi:effector-binding domain-containing protein
MLTNTITKPTSVLEQLMLQPMNVLFIGDTTDMAGLSKVIQSGYGELFAFINQNGLKPGKVMAFYHSYANPISLEVAVEVDHVPSVLSGRIQSKIVAGGEALVAHYTGPYEEMEIPYNAVANWLKDNNKQANGMPFEVYLNSPDTVKDKSELKTDVYQFLQ